MKQNSNNTVKHSAWDIPKFYVDKLLKRHKTFHYKFKGSQTFYVQKERIQLDTWKMIEDTINEIQRREV